MPFACKFCIALFGLKGSEIESLPTAKSEMEKHVREAHGYPDRTAIEILGSIKGGRVAAGLIEQSGPVLEVHALRGEFCVYQFFTDGSYERVRSFVPAEEAVKAARHYCACVGAKIGTTVRVTITDGGDFCVFEWKKGVGITWPSGGEFIKVWAANKKPH
jgi:hypothetical protein